MWHSTCLGGQGVVLKSEGDAVSTEIPDKTYFKIGEVAKIIGVKAYVIRYWESEFPMLRPQKTRSNQRLFQRRDIELLQSIKRLVHDEKFTIEGARLQLRQQRSSGQDGEDEASQAPSGTGSVPAVSHATGPHGVTDASGPTSPKVTRQPANVTPSVDVAQEAVNLSLFDEAAGDDASGPRGTTTRPMAQALRSADTDEEAHGGVTSAAGRWKQRAEQAEGRVEALESVLARLESTLEALLAEPRP